MLNKFCASLTLPAILCLSGCAGTPTQTYDTPATLPRPVSDKTSYAMAVTREIKTSAGCFACADTYLWEDESAYADKVGFDPYQIADQLLKDYREAKFQYKRAMRKWERDGRDPSTKPVQPVSPVDTGRTSSRSFASSSFVIADSLDGRWTNSTASLKQGIALGIGITVIETLTESVPDHNHLHPPVAQLKATMVLPDESSISFNHFDDPRLSAEEKQFRNIGAYAAQEFVGLLSKSAQDMGYSPVGNIRINYLEINGKPDWNYVWQPLENDAVGCPKVTPESERKKVCRIEWAPYRLLFETNQYSWRLEKTTIPPVFGGDGKRTGWIAHFGYDRMNPHPLRTEAAEHADDATAGENLNRIFALGLQKHLREGQYIYVPSYLENKKWSPECVLDAHGVHYFSVLVPRP